MSDKRLAITCFLIVTVCLTILVSIGPVGAVTTRSDQPAQPVQAAQPVSPAFSVRSVCTDDGVCGRLRLYSSGSVLDEGLAVKRVTDSVYLGWSSTDLGAYDRGYMTVPSTTMNGAARWHLYWTGR